MRFSLLTNGPCPSFTAPDWSNARTVAERFVATHKGWTVHWSESITERPSGRSCGSAVRPIWHMTVHNSNGRRVASAVLVERDR
jgi:hypothetical protein